MCVRRPPVLAMLHLRTTGIGPQRRRSMSAPMSAVGELSGLVVLILSSSGFDDPKLPFADRRGYGIFGWSCPRHSGLILAARITLPHFSVSSAISFRKSTGEPARIEPCSARRALIFGSARAALISRLSLSMIAVGVLMGAPIPNQVLVS